MDPDPGGPKLPDPEQWLKGLKCYGSGMFIPDPNFFHPGSRVKKMPGSGDPDLDILPIPDSGSRGQKGTGSRIRILKH
jgi:hypothetical protein